MVHYEKLFVFLVFPLQDKAKELELLCNLKTLTFDPLDHEKTVGKLMYVQDKHIS